jgi:hypothetical protein
MSPRRQQAHFDGGSPLASGDDHDRYAKYRSVDIRSGERPSWTLRFRTGLGVHGERLTVRLAEEQTSSAGGGVEPKAWHAGRHSSSSESIGESAVLGQVENYSGRGR